MKWLERILGSRDEPSSKGAARGEPEQVAGVQRVLDELRPMFEADGGDVELLEVDGGWVRVRLRGACTSCHASSMTLEGALEPKLRAALPWFRGLRSE